MAGNRRITGGPKGAAGPAGPAGPVGPAGDAWTKFTVTFQDFIDGGTGYVTLVNLATRRIIENAILKCSTAFATSGADPVYLRLRAASASSPDDTLIAMFPANTAVTISNLAQSHFLYAESLNASDVNLAVQVEFNGEGGALGDLTAGVVEIWVKLTDLP